MIISKKSWHYRLVNEFLDSTTEPSDSLCAYFWQLVLALIQIFGAIVFLLVVNLIVGLTVLKFGFGKDTASLAWYCELPLLFGVGLATIATFIGIACGLFIAYNKRSKDSIVIEYIKAKRNKYCPKIDFKD